MAFGTAGFSAAFIMQIFFIFITPIYQVRLGLNPLWLGYAVALPRLLDFLIDPLIGNFSDNFKTRWGRRRPLILAGAGLCALMLPFLWMPPSKDPMMMLTYLVVMCCLYTVGYALFEIPYSALGYEMTEDYDERTRVLAWRMYFGLFGLLIAPWGLKFCFHPIFGGDELKGAPWVSLGISCFILLGAAVTVLGVRERVPKEQEKVGLLDALKLTLTNKPFLMLLVVKLIVGVGIASIGSIGYIINVYEVCRLPDFNASKEFASDIIGWNGTLMAIVSYATLPAASWFSRRGSKRRAMMICIGVAIVCSASFWFTLDARWPYLQLISSVSASAAMNGVWLLMVSMIADLCDVDQLATGKRREGMFGASYSAIEKASLALASTLGGFLFLWAGYNPSSAEAGHVAPEVIERMKTIFIVAQCASLTLALLVLARYPLTRARSLEVRRLLDERANA